MKKLKPKLNSKKVHLTKLTGKPVPSQKINFKFQLHMQPLWGNKNQWSETSIMYSHCIKLRSIYDLHSRNQTTNLKVFKLCLISNCRIIPSSQGLILPSPAPR